VTTIKKGFTLILEHTIQHDSPILFTFSGAKAQFDKIRKTDINLEVAISNGNHNLTYYSFSEPAYNTFSQENAQRILNTKTKVRLLNRIEMNTKRLDTVLDKYLPKNKTINFLNIDVEGLELNVLKSNNWKKYRPNIITVENLNDTIENALNCEINNFLQHCGYHLIAKTKFTMFFLENNYDP
jgi:FkbM family methyltransferase